MIKGLDSISISDWGEADYSSIYEGKKDKIEIYAFDFDGIYTVLWVTDDGGGLTYSTDDLWDLEIYFRDKLSPSEKAWLEDFIVHCRDNYDFTLEEKKDLVLRELNFDGISEENGHKIELVAPNKQEIYVRVKKDDNTIKYWFGVSDQGRVRSTVTSVDWGIFTGRVDIECMWTLA